MFKNLSIQSKLFAIIWSTLLLALIFSSVAFITYDRHRSKLILGADTQALGHVLAARSAAALAFRDKKAAQENLNALDINLSLEQACLYNNKQVLFTQYQSKEDLTCPTLIKKTFIDKNELQPEPSKVIYQESSLQYSQAVIFKSHQFGTLLLQANYQQINERQAQFTKVAIIILLGCSLLGYLLTASLQRFITKPIKELASLSREVRFLGDYSLRAKQHSNDETGQLVDSFNNMLNQIQQTHWQMEDLVAEMKSQSQKSQLQATDAQSQTQAVRQFFAGASHDLKQPLNAIGLFSEILQSQALGPESKAVLTKLQQANSNLNELFAELLDNEKIESRLEAVQVQNCILDELITKLLLEFEPLAQDKGITLKSKISTRCQVTTDLHLLERILRNLLSNAIRYTQQGGILITLRRQSKHALLQIWDTGQGIPYEKQDAIFDQYVQLNNPKHETSKGFGLGLSIVRRLSKVLKHPINLKSVPNKGTCFSLQVCLTKIEESPKPENKANTQADNRLELNPFLGKKALIIDDEMISLEALEMQLSLWQLEVEMAQNSLEALEAVEEYGVEPDIIICDYHLGKNETGLELLQALGPKLKKITPVLMISAHANETMLNEFKKQGYVFISKPMKAAKLKAAIGTLLYKCDN